MKEKVKECLWMIYQNMLLKEVIKPSAKGEEMVCVFWFRLCFSYRIASFHPSFSFSFPRLIKMSFSNFL